MPEVGSTLNRWTFLVSKRTNVRDLIVDTAPAVEQSRAKDKSNDWRSAKLLRRPTQDILAMRQREIVAL
jgi:hypothetical protein